MPSLSSKQDPVKFCAESVDGMKNLQIYVEKKIRNLEKRKKRLDEYQKLKQSGERLEPQQEEALASMGIVVGSLDFARDMLSQIGSSLSEQEKAAKKAEKRQRIEKERRDVDLVRSLLSIQCLLDEMGSEETKALFSGEAPLAGMALSQNEFKSLDSLYQIITPSRSHEDIGEAATATPWSAQLQACAENCASLLEAKERPLGQGTTVSYREVRDLLDKLAALPYFASNTVPKLGSQEAGNDAAILQPEEDQAAAVAEPYSVDSAAPPSPPPSPMEREAQPTAVTLPPPAAGNGLPDSNHLSQINHAHELQQMVNLMQHQHLLPEPASVAYSHGPTIAAPAAVETSAGESLNTLRQKVKGQFDFIQDSELAPPASAAAMASSGVVIGAGESSAGQPTDWADDLPDTEQPGKSWADSSWSGSMQQPAMQSAPGSEDVFASATQSEFLRSASEQQQQQHQQQQQIMMQQHQQNSYHQQQQFVPDQQQQSGGFENGPAGGYGGGGRGRSRGGANEYRGGRGGYRDGGGGGFRDGGSGGGNFREGGGGGYRDNGGGNYRGGNRGGFRNPNDYRSSGGADFRSGGGGGGRSGGGGSFGGPRGGGRGGGGGGGFNRSQQPQQRGGAGASYNRGGGGPPQ